MDFQDSLRIASENPLCTLATVEASQPRVRPLVMIHADETGFYFQTHAAKALVRQLEADNRVEVCFLASGPKNRPILVLRVAGETEFITDLNEKRRVCKNRLDIINQVYGIDGLDDPRIVVFRIKTGEAYLWTPEYNLCESKLKRIRF